MQNTSMKKAAIFTLVTVAVVIVGWELWLRSQGIAISYDDGGSLWSDKRAKVYQPIDQSTVFIGSSRIKYDLDIATWKAVTGDNPVQLAIEGNSPMPVLDDLANDEKFKGKVIVDVTEGLFFSASPANLSEPWDHIAYYKKQTPAQKFSFKVNHLLESNLVFLDKYNYSVNGMLDKLKIPSRPGVFVMPVFPADFGPVNFERQDIMTPRFVSDTSLQNKVKGIWYFFSQLEGDPPMSGKPLDSLLNVVKKDVDKIKARGGQVLFVRTPSSGPYYQGESMGFPRPAYWDRLLSYTNCPGIHFKDYPAIANFECPELSHLSPSDAVIFTKNMIEILSKEKGWSFPRQSSTK